MTLHCVGNYEENRYHDSYFHSVFWDDENETLVTQMVGSTAFAGGATRTPLTDNQRVWEQVNEYRRRCNQQARTRVRNIKANRLRDARKILKDNGVHTAFTNSLSIEDLEDVAALFSNRVRNKFKLKMREQVLAWTPDSKFKTPLSEKQMRVVRRPLKDQYGRETKRAREVYIDLAIQNQYSRMFRGLGHK